MNRTEFLENVQKIAGSNPTYREGGSGKDGTCDCIGLIIGALGKKYDMHSTNYFARSQMRTLDNLLDESQLHAGAVVYKSRRDTSQLNARYQPGGRYYNGDLLDYYHVGVVTSIDPLEITHCTSSGSVNGIAYDDSIKAWSQFGDLLDVEMIEEEKTHMASYTATVTARNGSTVRMRSRPDDGAPTVTKVPIGQTVQVLEAAAGWAKIDWNGQRGYMMQEFVQRDEDSQDERPVDDALTITLPGSVAQALLDALNKALRI